MRSALRLFRTAAGRLESHVTLRREGGEPRLEGDLLVRGFSASMEKYLGEVENGRLQLAFTPGTLDLREAFLRSGGTLEASGRLNLGVDGLRGAMTLRTGEHGLKLDRWDDVARGFLELSPLTIEFRGLDEPVQVRGRVAAHDIALFWAGGHGAKPGGGKAAPPPLVRDLAVGLGEN